MEKLKGFLKLIRNAGYSETVFEKYAAQVTFQNNRMIKDTSFIGSILMILLTINSFFMSSVSRVFPLYILTAVGFIITYIIVKKNNGRNGKLVLVCNYAFLTIAFLFAIGLDVIQRNPTATTICVLLVALPLMVVDKPYREAAYFAIISVIFMIETVFIKKSPKASIDILNAVSFLLVGIFLGYKNDQMMLKNIINQKLLENQRDTDALTTLFNKGAMENKVVDFLNESNVTASMMIIDLDNFKFINDTYGHDVGDEILVKVGKVLMTLFRSSDLISRFGGDEFIIFLPMTDDRDILKRKAEQILHGVADIRIKESPDYRVQICIGIAEYPNDGGSYEELFKHADTAMYKVKKNGKNGYQFYDAMITKKILVVDDVMTNREVLKSIIEPEFLIVEAQDGKEAMDILANQRDISMVITDIQMPNMDGIELTRQIRSNSKYDHIAIIANTQYGDMHQEEEILNLGVDDFVYKPASPMVIQARVRNVMKIKG